MRVLFMGSGEIALPSLCWLIANPGIDLIGVVTQPDKPVGRHHILTAPAVKRIAAEAGLPVFQPDKIRDAVVVEGIAKLSPDFIIVMAYGQILPKMLLDLPRVACLNLHASILPKHRGASPIQSAILAGDKSTGITLMHMDVGLDTGDIVCTQEIDIEPDDTAGTLHDRLAEVGPMILEKGLSLFAQETALRIPQDAAKSNHSRKLARESGRIDWTQSAIEVERHIRAMHPWPGAFAMLPNGKKLKIHSGKIVHLNVSPGEVLQTVDDEFTIGTGLDALRLEVVQMEGKSKMSASDFLRGNSTPRQLL